MMSYIIRIFIWGFVVAKAELPFRHLFSGREIDFGPYNVKLDIGVLPKRYPHMSDNDKKACNSVRRLLEMLRDSGIDEMPSLDPYINSKFSPVPLNVPYVTGEVQIAQVIVTGLRAMKIEMIEVRLDTIRTDFNFTVPLVTGIVYFQTNLALGGLFPLSTKGSLRLKIQNMKVEGAVGGHQNFIPPKQFYTLSTLQTHFHAENVKVRLDVLNLDKDVLEFLQTLSPNIAREPIKKIADYVVAQEILNHLNRILEKFSVDQVKEYLLAR